MVLVAQYDIDSVFDVHFHHHLRVLVQASTCKRIGKEIPSPMSARSFSLLWIFS